MDAIEKLPLVEWIIPCFDKRREKPLPVYNRVFILDWSKLAQDEVADVMQIIASGDVPIHSPKELGSTVITVSRVHSEPDWRMHKYRKFFHLYSSAEWSQLISECRAAGQKRKQVNLNAEYFEDETGKPVTTYEMIQHVSGQSEPIIVGDAKSILRIGPSAPRDVGNWNTSAADTIEQFLEAIERICSSAWFKTPKTFTIETAQADTTKFPEESASQLLEAVFPNAEETMAVLAYFRQLHAADKLLANAVECYVKHCGDARKAWWVQERKDAFGNLVDAPPGILEQQRTRRRIFQLFMYGAGMLHSKSNDGADVELGDFVKEHGRERAVAIFHNCLMDLLSIAVPVYQVVRQDYRHWLSQEGFSPPNRPGIKTLFTSYVRDATDGR